MKWKNSIKYSTSFGNECHSYFKIDYIDFAPWYQESANPNNEFSIRALQKIFEIKQKRF